MIDKDTEIRSTVPLLCMYSNIALAILQSLYSQANKACHERQKKKSNKKVITAVDTTMSLRVFSTKKTKVYQAMFLVDEDGCV